MMLKGLMGAGVSAAILLGLAAPAWAHVTVDPETAPQGGEITLRFRVPNEVSNANVVKVDIAFPTDHPLLGVDVEPIPTWAVTVTQAKLNPPVQTDDGPVTQAVSEIVWTAASGGGTAPGQFQEFPVLVQQLPKDTNQVVFKAIQTYSDGSVVRWIDPVAASQAAPDHPTPILTLTAGSVGAAASTVPATSAGAPTDVSKLAQKSSVTTASTLGVFGISVGGVALIFALVALARRPNSSKDAPAP
jgi:uncharacterized protein YcnI